MAGINDDVSFDILKTGLRKLRLLLTVLTVTQVFYIATVVLLVSCFAKQYYIQVPYPSTRIFDTYPVELFSCVDCQGNYEKDIPSWYIVDDKLVGFPFDSDEYSDSVFLLKAHNTLNFIGYSKLISSEYYEKNIGAFVDSLLFYENKGFDSLNYYSKFLKRRELQGTRTVALSIIKDVKRIYSGAVISSEKHLVNDTIAKLVNLDYELKYNCDTTNSRETLMKIYDYFVSIGQYDLAYKISNRPIDFSLFGMSKDSLLLTLPIDTTRNYNFSDTTMTLGSFDKKGKWTDSYLMSSDNGGEGP